MNELLQQAIAEAYASAPQDEIVLHTLEINHKSFTQPIRVVRYPVSGPEPERFNCLLEADAPYNPGQVVEFIGLPFELTLPEKDTESPGQFTIRVDNVGDALDEYLENAALGGSKITAIYREYIKGREADGPAQIWQSITLHSPRQEGQSIIMDGAVIDWMFKKFGRLYKVRDYPALALGR
jgi:hypothetical protein